MKTSTLSRGDLTILEKLSGINATTISRILNGTTENPGVKTMSRIDKALAELSRQKSQPRKNADKKAKVSRGKASAGVAGRKP